jgi:hypothetical protein
VLVEKKTLYHSVFILIALILLSVSCGTNISNNSDGSSSSGSSSNGSSPGGSNSSGGSSSPYVDLSDPEGFFAISSSSRTAPEDVLVEVSFVGDPGGSDSALKCSTFGGPFSQPTVVKHKTRSLEWWQFLSVITCGWQPGESVDIALYAPSGSVVSKKTIQARSDGRVYYSYIPELNATLGSYSITFEGESGSLKPSFSVISPRGPRVYQSKDRLILYNFRPNEEVRLLAFRSTGPWVGEFTAWEQYHVDSSGKLVIRLQGESERSLAYVIIGDRSGQVSAVEDHLAFAGTGIPTIVSDVISASSSSYSVTASRPTQAELQSVRSFWDLTSFRDLKSPGTQTYNVSVNSANRWQWLFLWCGTDDNILQEILRPLSVRLFIDDVELSTQIHADNVTSSSGWACRRWSTILSNWSAGDRVKLEIRYRLDEEIFDGVRSYPAGQYRQVIVVDVQ